MERLLENFKKQTVSAMQAFKQEMSGIRTNRPSAALVEHIPVHCYNQTMPLKQVGSIGVLPPREIHIQIWDKSIMPNVVKAIEGATLGLTAHQEGDVVRIHLPELSAERKQELIRYAKKRAEEFRIRLRQERDDANKEIQKMFSDGEAREDVKFKLKEDIQKEVDRTNKEIDAIIELKISEINA